MSTSSIAKWFLAAFLASGVFGYYKGREAVSSESTLQDAVFRPVTFQAAPAQFVYRRGDTVLYRFDLATSTLLRTPAGTAALMNADKSAGIFPTDKELVFGLFGVLGVSAKEIIKGKTGVKAMVQVLALGSGYWIGYKYGAREPNPASADVQRILNDEKHWIAFKKRYLQNLLARAFQLTAKQPDNSRPIEIRRKLETLFADSEKQTAAAIDASQIVLAAGLHQSVLSALQTESVQDTRPFWMKWWWVGLVVFVLVLCVWIFGSSPAQPAHAPEQKHIRWVSQTRQR